MQGASFLNSPVFNLFFYCHSILDSQKVDFSQEIQPYLALEVKLSGKFHRFKNIDGNMEMQKNSGISKKN